MRRLHGMVAAVALCLGSSAVQWASAEEDIIEVTLDQGITIEDFLKSSSRTGLSIAWDPTDKAIRGRQLTSPVNLRVPKRDFFAHVRALLTFYDLVLVPVGPDGSSTYLVMDVRQTTTILKMKPEPIEVSDAKLKDIEWQDGWFVTTMISAPHLADLRDTRNALQRLVTGQNIGSVQEIPAAHAFLVTDFAPTVAAVYRMVRKIDDAAAAIPAPEAAKSPKNASQIVPVRNAEASRLAALLSTQFGAATAAPTTPPTPPTEPGLRIQGDVRTNSVLVDGPAEVVDRVLRAIETLDADPVGGRAEVRVLPVSLSSMRDVARTVDQIVEKTPDLWRRTAAGPERPVVIVHPESRALIVRAPPPTIEVIAQILRSMEASVAPPDSTPSAPDPNRPVREKLGSTKMTLDLQDVRLQQFLDMLHAATQVQFVLTPAAIRGGVADLPVSLKVDGISADKVLDLVVTSLPARWEVRDGIVYVRDTNGR